AAASGMIGVFALMRRMSLAADAISHIALPGLGLAFLYKINPLIGGAATLFLGTILIWNIESRTKIPTETIIGVIFSLSLAIGSLVTPREDLIEALFGGVSRLSAAEFSGTITLAILIIGLTLYFKNQFIIQMTSPDLAVVTGLKVKRLNLYFLLLFSLTVILGLKFLGALLMGSLIIIPAAAAKNIGWNTNSMLGLAVSIGILSVIGGFFISNSYHFTLGPTVIVLAGLIFLMSLLPRKN
ncbi:metal ABC transporter permease, partial [Candidatus Wolfebacteria bacterium]|nr:metal ABC transporter permease [Candidatus Wolfebacteria bacterium]